jgi:SAM-dependent methyltransferase
MEIAKRIRWRLNSLRQKMWEPGIAGRGSHASRAIPEVAGLESEVLFRYATCDDLVSLKARFPEDCFFGDPISNASEAWGLKQMGTLFCLSRILDLKPARVLEVGAGCDVLFDHRIGDLCEYWMADEAGFYSSGLFEEAAGKRKHTRFVDTRLGAFCPELPDGYFDMVFSLSVLEHVPMKDRAGVYRDMFRVLHPGGRMVHSIDRAGPGAGSSEFEIIRQAGFILPEQPDLTVRTLPGSGPATLFEPTCIVFRSYFGKKRPDMWTNLRNITHHSPTILVAAQKPLT